MKRFISLLMLPAMALFATVTVAGWSGSASAQEAIAPAKIAVIDQRRLFSESKVSEDIREQLTQVAQKFATDENDVKEGLLRERDDLERQRGLLAPEAFEERFNQLRQRADMLNRQADIHQKQLNVAQVRANRELQRVLTPIITQVADRRNATLVLEKSQIVYQVAGLDVTTEVIELLDTQLPTLRVQMPTEAEIIEMERQAEMGNGQIQ